VPSKYMRQFISKPLHVPVPLMRLRSGAGATGARRQLRHARANGADRRLDRSAE
jgi:hypothetical protein